MNALATIITAPVVRDINGNKTLATLATEAVAASVIRRAWQPWDGQESWTDRDNLALDKRDAFLAALEAETGIARPLWEALISEGVL